MNINKNYKYFVVDTCDWLVVSGWEYKEDALDHLDELLEGITTAVTGDYKIYTTRYLNNKDINPFNDKNWIPGDYMGARYNKKKQYKVTVEQVKYCTYLVNAKSEDDIYENMNPEIDGKQIFTKPKSDEIIDVVQCDKVSKMVSHPGHEFDDKLENLLGEQFSLHEVYDIVDLIQTFSKYTKSLSETDSNGEDDFRDFLQIYLEYK